MTAAYHPVAQKEYISYPYQFSIPGQKLQNVRSYNSPGNNTDPSIHLLQFQVTDRGLSKIDKIISPVLYALPF